MCVHTHTHIYAHTYIHTYTGIDVDAAKSEEERIMLIDANKLKNNPTLGVPLGSSQATPLHVAAAKNYLDVLK